LAFVGQDPLDPRAVGPEERRGVEQEPGTGGASLVTERLPESDPAHVVDRDVEVVVAGASVGAVRAVTPTPETVATAVGDVAQRS
jgi:hypothetical protein